MNKDYLDYYDIAESAGSGEVADSKLYVERTADKELFKALNKGIYTYILCSRQSGKSSLMNRFIKNSGEDKTIIVIDIEDVNEHIAPTIERFYQRIIAEARMELDLSSDLENKYFQRIDKVGGTLALREFIEQEILRKNPNKNVVFFIEEIDALKALPYPTDDFLAFVRSCNNRRGNKPEYKRLTFCLIGVNAPNELIQDNERTPFNIGQSIKLTPFQVNDNKTEEVLIYGLKRAEIPDYQNIYRRIFYWTGGQPFLTLKLLHLTASEYKKEQPCHVDKIVNDKFISQLTDIDKVKVHLEHLETQFLIRGKTKINKNNIEIIVRNLKTYHQILSSEEKVNWKELQLEQDSIDQLVLVGLVIKEGDYAYVYNRIYRQIFNFNWINEKLEEYGGKLLVNKKALIVVCDERVSENSIIIQKAKKIAEILENQGEFQVIQLFHNVTIDKLENSLVELFNSQGANLDTALFYFIGSGISDRYGRHYKLKADNNDNKDGLELWWLNSELRLSNIPRKIVWLDCTYSEKWINFSEVFPETKRELYGKTLDNFFITMSPKSETIINPEDKGKLTEILYQELIENQGKNTGINSYSLAASISEKLYEQDSFDPFFLNVGNKPIDLILNQGKLDSNSEQKSDDIKLDQTPYKGLESFSKKEKDAKYFFGRSDLISRLFDELIKSNFLAVLGASGSGKSSVVKAGLVYQLTTSKRVAGFNPNTEIAVFRPGKRPLYNLLKALIEENSLPNSEEIFKKLNTEVSTEEFLNKLKVELSKSKQYSLTKLRKFITDKSGQDRVKDSLILAVDQFEEEFIKTIQIRGSKLEKYSLTELRRLIAEYLGEDRVKNSLILVVDQFEEIFTMCKDEKERQRFFDCLLTANQDLDSREFSSTNSLKIIITMRSDFLPNCAKYPELQTQIDNYGVTVSDMTRDNYIEAITKPAKKVGLTVTESLLEKILEDMEDSFGALPLLQFVLQQLWQSFKEKKEVYGDIPNELTLQNYSDLGGIKGTLEKKAEEVFTQQLTLEEQKIAQQIFIELTDPLENSDSKIEDQDGDSKGSFKLDLRRRLSKAELIKTLVNNDKQSEDKINYVINPHSARQAV